MTTMKNNRLDLPSTPIVMITPADPQPSNGRTKQRPAPDLPSGRK